MAEQEIKTLSQRVKEYFALDNAAKSWWNTKGNPRYDRQLYIIDNEIDAKDKVILDVGTGRGRFAIQYVKGGAKKVIAIDISNGMLEIAKENAIKEGVEDCIDFLQRDVEEQPFESETFHIINCMEVYVHLPNPQRTTNQFFSYLIPGGILVANIDLPLTKKWYFHWINEPFLTFRRFIRGLYLVQIARYVYYEVLPSFIRKIFHKQFNWPLQSASPIVLKTKKLQRKLSSTEETIAALKNDPSLKLSRAEDAINRMDLKVFIEILKSAGFEIVKIIQERKWYQLPYGYIVIGKKNSG